MMGAPRVLAWAATMPLVAATVVPIHAPRAAIDALNERLSPQLSLDCVLYSPVDRRFRLWYQQARAD